MSLFSSGKQVFPLRKVGPEEHGSTQMTALLQSVVDLWETTSLQRSLGLEPCQFSGFIPTPLFSHSPPDFLSFLPWSLMCGKFNLER